MEQLSPWTFLLLLQKVYFLPIPLLVYHLGCAVKGATELLSHTRAANFGNVTSSPLPFHFDFPTQPCCLSKCEQLVRMIHAENVHEGVLLLFPGQLITHFNKETHRS